MKRYITKIVLALTVLSVCIYSCKQLDDTRPFDKFDETAVWSSKSNAMLFVNGVYSSVLGLYTNTVEDEVRTSNIIQSDGNAFTRESITRDGFEGCGRWF